MFDSLIENKYYSFKNRLLDIAFVLFFIINILFITYIVDLEQLVIANPNNFTYPIWPPPFMVDMIHSYGRIYDPLLMARPVWWKVTVLIDAVFFGPFYLFGIFAFLKKRNWIKIPSIIYSSVMLTNVVIILGEEIYGPYASPQLLVVLLVNLPWLLIPLLIIYRMSRTEKPFTI